MVTDGSVPVERVGRAALRRSFRRRSLKRCAALFVSPVSPDFEIRIGTAVWVPGTCRPPPLLGQAPGTTIAPSFARIGSRPHLHRCRTASGRARTFIAAEHLSQLSCG